jgi:hypothetical protein
VVGTTAAERTHLLKKYWANLKIALHETSTFAGEKRRQNAAFPMVCL